MVTSTADVHHGQAAAVREQRAAVLSAAYAMHPERFIRQPPRPPRLTAHSWISPPQETEIITQ